MIDFNLFQQRNNFLLRAPLVLLTAITTIPPSIVLTFASSKFRHLASEALSSVSSLLSNPKNIISNSSNKTLLLSVLKPVGALVAASSSHLALLIAIPHYAAFYRWLLIQKTGIASMQTSILQGFMSQLVQLTRSGNMQMTLNADVSNLTDFFATKSRSIRRRMMNQIPKEVPNHLNHLKVVIREKPLVVSFGNLAVQLSHCRRYNMDLRMWFASIVNLYMSDGFLFEYYDGDKLVAQCIAVREKNSYTILQYSCIESASTSGIWFFNVRQNIEHAILLNAEEKKKQNNNNKNNMIKVICGTGADHKVEAKKHCGFEYVASTSVKEIEEAYGVRAVE